MSCPRNCHLRRADGTERRALDQRLRALHRVAVVGVRLVPLDLRELGRVLVRDALVAEVLRQLVHLLEAADDQPLEVELVGDAEVEVGVELVRVRDERLREAAAVARLEDRRLDLEEALAVEVRAHLGDDARPRGGESPRVLVHQQVEVAPPITLLDVGDPVKRVRQRRADLREQLERAHRERRLAAARLRRRALHADDVAEIQAHVADLVRTNEQLDASTAVDEVEEHQPAHVAPRHDAPGKTARRRSLGLGLERVRLGANRGDLVPVRETLRQRHRASVSQRRTSQGRLRRCGARRGTPPSLLTISSHASSLSATVARTRAATPPPSRARPRRMCSVAM